ncbi:MAG: hypothetical protein ACYDEF_10750 [Methanosarcina sp.]
MGSKLFGSVATIDRAKAEQLTHDFIDTDNEKDYNSHNSHTTLTSNVRDKNDNSIDNNNNNNNKLTNIGEREGSNCAYTNVNNSGEIEKSHAHNSCESFVREKCEDSSKLWQPITNTDVRVDVRALTYGATDSVNKCDHNVRDKQENIFAVVDLLKNSDNLTQLITDLGFFKSAYLRTHGGIESIEVFVGAFEKGIPGKKTNFSGYFKLFPRQAIIYEADRICKTVPQPFMSRVVSVDEGLKILEEDGY